MWTYIKIFPHAFTVKFRIGSPKTARNEQVCTPKSHTGSKFSKTSLGCYTPEGWLLRFFSSASDGATADRHIQNCIIWSIGGRIASRIMDRFGRCFRLLLEAIHVLCNTRYVVPSVSGTTRFANLQSKFSRTRNSLRGHAKISITSY